MLAKSLVRSQQNMARTFFTKTMLASAANRGRMLPSGQRFMPYNNLVAMNQMRFFSEGADGEEAPKRDEGPVPRFLKNRFVVLDIPETVTEEQLVETFSQHGELHNTRYIPLEERKENFADATHGVFYVGFKNTEDAVKMAEEINNEVTVGDATLRVFN